MSEEANGEGGMVSGHVTRDEKVAGEISPPAAPGPAAGELRLALIWAEVLERDRVEPDDDFFALGGSSIAVGQMMARVHADTGVELTFRDVFEAPTLRELFAAIEVRRTTAAGAEAPIGAAAPAHEYPLTDAQQRMWFIEQLHPDRPTFRMITGLRLRGALRPAALERALADLVGRHAALRTTFHERDGVPAQSVQPAGPVPLPVLDLRDLPAGTREAEARRLARQEARRRLDLRTGPMLRALLVRVGDDEHVLLLVVHHLVFDAGSRVVVLRELGELYRAAAQGTAPRLAPIPVDYPDFAVWQQSLQARRRREEDRAYWLEQLGAEPPVLELPPDRPRPKEPDFEGVREPVDLPAGMNERLREAAAREGTTVASVLLTAFEVLLHRHTESDSMVLGLLVAGRGRRESEALVGLFVNELALRLDISAGDSFRALLERTARSMRNGLAHQDEPLDDLLRAVRAVRPMGNSPLFHVAFNFKPQRDAALNFGEEIAAEEVALDPGVAPFDLTLTVDLAGEELSCHLEYARELFDPSRIRRMAGHYRMLLEGLLREPDRPVGELAILGEEEQAEFRAWNRTDRDYPRNRLIHELVEEQVDRAPGAVAVTFGEERLTYGELDRRANQLAHHLRSLGAGPDKLVGIMLERSTEMVVALLAIHKAGAAYVPLDPAFPAERLAFMAADAALPMIVSQRSLRSVLPPHQGTVVEVDGDAEVIVRTPAARLPRSGRPEGLAYVLYTSGSTGMPKGVQVPVSAVVNFLWSVRMEPGLSADDRLVAVTTLSFDIAVLELWLPLVVGARIVLASREVASDGARLRRLIEDAGVTLMQATPTTWRLLLAAGWKGSPAFRAICGGEALPADLAEDLAARATVWNMYGPTETTVWSTLYRLPCPVGPVLIGRPLANTELHVLDRCGRQVPVGAPGELFIGGDGVTRGYLNRPELTAERFLPDPFRVEPGARIYRTGDTVRFRSSGDLEFLGRGDNQVKLRGFRIELGEIEAALARSPGVGAAVVLLREDHPGDPRLVGYLACGPAAAPDDGTLREQLRRTLPDYMVPSAFVRLERLPLTPNNKIDRRALPAPELGAAAEGGHVAPRTRTEAVLAALWQEVLQLPRVGVEDDFFALGGHSLLAMRVAVLGQARLDVDLTVRKVFDHPTVASLAAFVDREREAGRVFQGVARVGRDRPAPLSPQQYALWLETQLRGESDSYNVPSVFRVEARLDPERLRRALLRLVDRHEVLRARVVDLGGEPHLAFDSAGMPFLHRTPPTEELLQLELTEVLHRPFDLRLGSPWRCALWSAPDGGSVLALVVHHLVLDNAAQGILLRELARAYTDPDDVPSPGEYDFADLAADENRRLVGGREELERFWAATLAGADLTPELPRPCVPCPPGEEGATCANRRGLGPGLAAKVRDLAARCATTPFHVYFTAWLVLLRTYTRQDDLVVGSLVSLRDTPASEGVVGYLLAPVALRARLDGARSFQEALEELGRRWREVREHARLPMNHIVRAAARSTPRGAVGSPFQVFFTLVEDVTGVLRMDGAVLQPIATSLEQAKFRLSLRAIERGDDVSLVLDSTRGMLDPDMGARMLSQLELILDAAAERPFATLDALPRLTPSEERLLAAWNDTGAHYPRERLLHQLVEEQVDRNPDAVAVEGEGEALTYRELDRRANRLAHHLQSLGAGPEALVGVALDRTPEMVVALLAIHKAGAGYVPLDPALPADRLAIMVEESGLRVVVTQRKLRDEVPTGGAAVVELDGDAGVLAARPDARPPPTGRPDGLAYLLYTSGSTGRPKGVEVPMRAVVNFVWAAMRDPGVKPGDRMVAHITLSFDPSVAELWLPLAAGACIVLASREVAVDGHRLRRLLERAAVNVMITTPATMRLLIDAGWSGGPGFRVNCGGEALTPDLAEQLLDRAEVWNMYGPTETTVWSTLYRLPRPAGPVRIGFPIANTRVHVLDERGRQVPLGVPGELYIGGEGVARGYHGRADLTAERFVNDPFQVGPGARLYRTGDLVRWTGGEGLEFLGRNDDQVKLRGYRIELGEIEAALCRVPGVRGAAAVVREDRPGEKRLVGYLACDTPGPTSAELREQLGRTLPEYMVPTAFVALERLPHTTSGKVDRRALPAPPAAGPATEEGFVPPRTDLERTLSDLWRQVLELPRVGIHDDFFALGGHSLLAMRLAVLGQERLDVDLTVRNVFENPTVAVLAAWVMRQREEGKVSRRVARVDRGQPVPLSPQQYALWLEVQLRPDADTYNTTAAFRVEGRVVPARMRKALERLAAAHEVLRARILERNGEPHLAFDLAAAAVELVEREAPTEEALQRGLAEEMGRAFDLETGPLWRCVLWRGPGGHSVLALVVHHIVLDAAGLGILLQQLTRLYSDPDVAQPARTHDFADLAADERERLAREREGLTRFWRETFAGADLTPELPRPCVPCPPGKETHACVARRPLGASLVRDLRELAARWGTTPFHIHLAGWLALLRTYTGQDDLVVGSLVSLRDTPASEGVVGYLLSPLALRARLDPAWSFRQAVEEVADAWNNLRAHARLPMNLIVQAVAGEGPRAGVGSPFQVFFALVEDVTGVLRLDGQALEPVVASPEHAKFKLSLSVVERGSEATLVLEAERGTLDPEMAERMLRHLDLLLRVAVERPDQALSDLPTVTPEDGERLEDWNATAMPFPRDASIPALLEEQVVATPGALAVVGDGLSLTYGDLDRRANQLAHHLRSLGIGPETIVGLVAERSPETVVALYAILKAGAAYLPLDPDHPRERVLTVLEDAGVPLIVAAHQPDWGTELEVEVVRLDDQGRAARIARESEARPGPLAGPESLAYVIYTSGSTGRPKGVLVTHRSAVNMWFGYRDAALAHGPKRPLRVSLDASLTFDASVEQVLCLLGGHTLHIAPEEVRLDAGAMVEYVRHHALDVLDWVPTQMRALLEAGLLASGQWRPGLVLVGGEAIDEATWQALAAEEGVESFNFYGPTECTVNATVGRITASRDRPHIGGPLGNTQARVLDRDLKQVPVGVVGELYLGGEGVARGYLRRPELTQERFVPDPFASNPGARLYRTGDRARWVDGRLEYLGRTDGQVKLRGLRIELGEIEATLERHPSVLEAATVARGVGEAAQLVAFVVARDPGHPPDPAVLRSFLKETLPGYMVPPVLVGIDALPRTSGRKVDRRTLQDLDVELERPAVPRRRHVWTPTGKRLYEVWGDLLGRRDIEPDDDFFDIGGHSLLAVRLMTEIEKAFGLRLPPATLVRAPTLAQLAALLEERNPAPPSRLVALHENGTRPPLFLITPFHGDALMFRELARTLAAQPVYALQPPPIVGTRCQETVESAAAEMVEMITAVQPEGPYHLAGYCIGGHIAFEVASQLAARGRRIAFLGLLDSVLASPRAFRAALGRQEGDVADLPRRARALGAKLVDGRRHLRRVRDRTRRILMRATFEFCRWTGARQPGYLQDEGYLDGLVASLYRPRPYPGSAVLFRSAITQRLPSPPGGGWATVVARLEEVEVVGDHIAILHPPDVHSLGEKINTALEAAREAST